MQNLLLLREVHGFHSSLSQPVVASFSNSGYYAHAFISSFRASGRPGLDTPLSLLERLRQADDSVAWRDFVYLYTPILYHWAWQLGLQGTDAAALGQEIFLAVCNALPEYHHDRQRRFRVWLFTLMRNKWQDWRQRRIPAPVNGNEAALAESAPRDQPAMPEEAEDRAHLCARALRLIQSEFPPATWMTFWATVVEGRLAKDVALKFGITANAVYLARGRVLRRLRKALDGLLD
jgi:RNA polymerase sigma factor (sigma-70 family)